MREVSGPAGGRVISWNADEGWGVLQSPEVPAEVWCHFSAVDAPGYRELTVGEAVSFTWEAVEQDGYHYSAVAVRRHRGTGSGAERALGEHGKSNAHRAYESSARIVTRSAD